MVNERRQVGKQDVLENNTNSYSELGQRVMETAMQWKGRYLGMKKEGSFEGCDMPQPYSECAAHGLPRFSAGQRHGTEAFSVPASTELRYFLAIESPGVSYYINLTMQVPLIRLQCGANSYDWGKVGKESAVAKFAAATAIDFSIQDDKPYAEV